MFSVARARLTRQLKRDPLGGKRSAEPARGGGGVMPNALYAAVFLV